MHQSFDTVISALFTRWWQKRLLASPHACFHRCGTPAGWQQVLLRPVLPLCRSRAVPSLWGFTQHPHSSPQAIQCHWVSLGHLDCIGFSSQVLISFFGFCFGCCSNSSCYLLLSCTTFFIQCCDWWFHFVRFFVFNTDIIITAYMPTVTAVRYLFWKIIKLNRAFWKCG